MKNATLQPPLGLATSLRDRQDHYIGPQLADLVAVTAPARVSTQPQSLLHFIGECSWSDEKVLAKGCEDGCARNGAPSADRGFGSLMTRVFPKQGQHSVGAGVQYCGHLGKQDNRQVAGLGER
jgi:SRSO17 transposase